MASLGLHVGSTSISIAIHQDGKTEIIANDSGERITPAVIAFSGKEKMVGIAARQGLIRNAKNTVCHVKTLLSCNAGSERWNRYNKEHACKIVGDAIDTCYFDLPAEEFSKKPVTVKEALTILMFKLMETAKSRCGGVDSDYDAVIAVPSNFGDQSRNYVKEAAMTSGFNVLQIISEPAASLLAYDVGQLNMKEDDGHCIVYRMGGQSLDVTVAHVSGGILSVVASVEKFDIGGDTVTDLLVEYFADEFRRRIHCDVHESRRSMAKLLAAAENTKHVLSTMSTAQCFVESLHEGVDFHCNITRARLESLLNGVTSRFFSPITLALEKAEVKPSDITKVVLSGGATKMPKIQQSIGEMFPSAEVIASIPSDEVIAIGCAQQAAMGKFVEEVTVQVPCLSRGIYVNLVGNEKNHLHCVFPKRTIIPSHAQRVFHIPEGQNSCSVELWESNSEDSSGAQLVGKVVLKELPNLPEIGATFHLRRDGSLHVTCTEKRSAMNCGITIEALVSS